MKPDEFKALPPLIPPCRLEAVGFSRKIMLALRHVIPNGGSPVPSGKIGYLRISKTFGKYRRSDVARILGPEWL